jgi:FKBP-type peptidyl-prolyl cis-trans isomerase
VEDKKEDVSQGVNWSSEHSTQFGETITKEEDVAIKLFLKQRKDWNITSTGTGLRYWIYEKSDGKLAQEGDIVKVEFKVKLLDGTLCYQTDKDEYSVFKVDKSDVETGVQEGIKYMREGEKAKLIIPSHLGHGLIGDLDKIPPMQVLLVDLFLKEIE